MSEKRTTTMRMNDETVRAINMMAAERQRATGRSISANEALWAMIERCEPDIAAEAKRLAQEEKGKKKK